MDVEPPIADTEDDADDPIVKEIPIIHSKRLEESLYLFQYPLVKKQDNSEMNIQKCFFKPLNQEVKMEMSIDTSSPNFDLGKAEIIAHEVDSSNKQDKHVYFESEMVDKIFMKSSTSVRNCQKYALAAFNGKEIHLTSLKGIFQMRPVFPYLERGLKKRKKELDPDNSSDDEEAGPSTAEQVTVQFKRDDGWIRHMKGNNSEMKAKMADEQWKECVWHDKDSTTSTVERLKLISDNTDDNIQARNLSDAEYIKLLVPEDQEQGTMEPILPSHIISLHALRTLPLQDQCRLLLKDAQIIQFHQLFMLLAGEPGLTESTLIKSLLKVANVVRGNFVVKSEILYPKDTFSATRGVPAELMCKTRDYVLYQFTKQQYVERKKVSSVMKIPSEEVKEIFTGISKLRHNKGWELSLPCDTEFYNKHNDVVQRQNNYWQERYNQILEFLNNNNKERKQRRKSKSISEDSKRNVSSDNDSGTEIKSPVLARKNKAKRLSESMAQDVTT